MLRISSNQALPTLKSVLILLGMESKQICISIRFQCKFPSDALCSVNIQLATENLGSTVQLFHLCEESRQRLFQWSAKNSHRYGRYIAVLPFDKQLRISPARVTCKEFARFFVPVWVGWICSAVQCSLDFQRQVGRWHCTINHLGTPNY